MIATLVVTENMCGAIALIGMLLMLIGFTNPKKK